MLVVGVEHRGAPLDLLERVAFGENELAKVLGTLRDRSNLAEVVVLSTCLRTEVYAVADRFHDAVHEIEDVLADKAGLDAAALEPHRTVRFDDDVAVHLFSVAAGLESAVPGEGEVLGQVRRAWERAQEERVSGPVLAELFRDAVRVGKRVRTETAIARGTTSFSHAAVELAASRRAGGIAGTTVVVVGTGEMGSGVAGALASLPGPQRPGALVLVNRTRARAESLAQSLAQSLAASPEAPGAAGVGALTVRVLDAGGDEAAAALGTAHVVVTAVEAAGHVVSAAQLAPDGDRAERPILVVDLGVPRNVDRAVVGLAGVTVLDLDDLTAAVGQALEERRAEAEQARTIVAEEVERHRAVVRARGAAPVVAALRQRLEELRVAELERRRGQFGVLGDEQWAQLDAVTRAVLAKLLHDPTTVLKESAGTARGERLVEALRTLFDL